MSDTPEQIIARMAEIRAAVHDLYAELRELKLELATLKVAKKYNPAQNVALRKHGRNVALWNGRQKGRLYRELAQEFGISTACARQIYLQEDRRQEIQREIDGTR